MSTRATTLTKLAASLAVTALVLEALVRGVLFQGWFADVEALAPLRRPSNYAAEWQDDYWMLRHLVGRAPQIDPERVDDQLGWLPVGVKRCDAGPGQSEPPRFEHPDRSKLDGRRPVLLYGDSYAAGLTPRRTLFQTLMERSTSGGDLRMINYGCPGYGLDQAVLLMERSIETWAELDPIVLIGVLLDDDFDRSLLSIRTLPKPRFVPSGDGLALERTSVPTAAAYIGESKNWLTLWSWKLLVHGGPLPRGVRARLRGDAAHRREGMNIARSLMERAIDELEARDLAFGFVLFHAPATVREHERLEWREALALEVLEDRGVPYTLSRNDLLADMAAGGEPLTAYFYDSGMQRNHLNRQGNQVVFRGILELTDTLRDLRPRRSGGGD